MLRNDVILMQPKIALYIDMALRLGVSLAYIASYLLSYIHNKQSFSGNGPLTALIYHCDDIHIITL